jgi:hypothetical protein
MRLDKKFLATLLGVDESEIASISGLTFEPTNASGELATLRSFLADRLKRRAQALTRVLAAEDDLGAVVRAHIHIEHELQGFIFFAAPHPDQLTRFDQMEFSEKVRLALVLGLNSELKPALNAAGNLRNKFSHRLDMKLGEEEAKNLMASLTPSARQRFQAIHQRALSEVPEASLLTDDRLSSFRAQFQVMVFFLALFDGINQERQRLAFEKLQSVGWH